MFVTRLLRTPRSFALAAVLFTLATPAFGGDEPALDPEKSIELAERITDEDDPVDAAKALEELRKLGDDGVWYLLDAAKEADEDEFDALSDALIALGKDAIPELVKTLGDDEESVVALAVSALEDLKKDAMPLLLDVVRGGIKGAKDPQDVRSRAGVLLQDIGVDAIPGLVAIVKAGPQEAREVASAILVGLGEPSVKPLVGILDGTKEGRESARAALIMIGATSGKAAREAVVKATLDLLKSKNADLRAVAVHTVGTFGDEKAVASIVDCLCNEDEKIRESGVACAALLGEPAVPDLLHCLGVDDGKVADAAVRALAEIGECVVPGLEKALKAPVPKVRGNAIRVLGAMKHRPSIERVISFLDDADAEVRTDAQRALESMTGEKLATRTDGQAWWDKHKAEVEDEARKAAEAKKAEAAEREQAGEKAAEEARRKAESEKESPDGDGGSGSGKRP